MDDWQGIETAPKDGNEYLFCIADGRSMKPMYVAYWVGGPVVGYFLVMGSDREQVMLPCHVTHWMPLPAPPAPNQNGG